MNKEEYIKIVKSKLSGKPKKIMLEQIENYYDAKNSEYISQNRFENGENVLLKKGTLLHGTYKNIEGLKSILDDGLISSWFTYGRLSKYPSSVGVWNLKEDCLLKDYINFYSGGTIEYKNFDGKKIKTSVIPYNEMKNIMNVIDTDQCFRWFIEQTKEARFMPSLVQNLVQIGIIFDNNNKYMENLLKYDILNKDDFFTDRESAILFGIPANFIEGILVGRTYENDKNILEEIKLLLPNCYICNLDGKVIIGNK